MKRQLLTFRSSHPEVFCEKGVLKLCSKITGEHPCWSVISMKLLCNLIEITLRHGCSPVDLLHIFRTPFPRNTSGWLLLNFHNQTICSNQCIQKSIANFLCSFLYSKYDTRYSLFEKDVLNYEDLSILYLHNFFITTLWKLLWQPFEKIHLLFGFSGCATETLYIFISFYSLSLLIAVHNIFSYCFIHLFLFQKYVYFNFNWKFAGRTNVASSKIAKQSKVNWYIECDGTVFSPFENLLKYSLCKRLFSLSPYNFSGHDLHLDFFDKAWAIYLAI